MKTTKKKSIVKKLDIIQTLLQKCGGPGGTMGPCPSGIRPKPGMLPLGAGRADLPKLDPREPKNNPDKKSLARYSSAVGKAHESTLKTSSDSSQASKDAQHWSSKAKAKAEEYAKSGLGKHGLEASTYHDNAAMSHKTAQRAAKRARDQDLAILHSNAARDHRRAEKFLDSML